MLSIKWLSYQYLREGIRLCLALILLIFAVVAGGHMKKFFILFAFTLVFTSAIFARAAQSNTHLVGTSIKSIAYNEKTMVVKISGFLPNLCAIAPRPTLIPTKNPRVIQLSVAAEMNGDVCMAVTMVGGTFELAFDIRSLKFDLADIHMDTEAKYEIVSTSGEKIAEIDFGQYAFDFPFATHKVSGGVFAVMNDGRVIVKAEQGQDIEVRSPFINLKKYIGRQIDVAGFVVKGQHPALGNNEIERPIFLLTGLNTTAL
jgi:hypothetical protein